MVKKFLVIMALVASLIAFGALSFAPVCYAHPLPPPISLDEDDGVDIHHPEGEGIIYRHGKEGPPICSQQIAWRHVDGHWFGIPATISWIKSFYVQHVDKGNVLLE